MADAQNLQHETLNRILVATDFSVAGQRAVTRAGQLAHQYTADLQIVHATPDWNLFSRSAAARQQHYDEITLFAQSAMRNEVNRVLSTFGVHAQGEVQLGKASEVISRKIESYQPNLVVAGARGEHEPRIAPAALGGTSLKLFFRLERPTLLVRNEDAHPYVTSLAAVKQVSELSQRVVLWGTTLVPSGDCHIFHAYESPYIERLKLCGTSSATIEACVLDAKAAARESFDQVSTAAVPGSRVHLHLEHGDPLGILVTEIATFGPQLVVIGRHESDAGKSAPGFSGSMGLRMAYHTPVDVLVVP